MYTIYLLKKFFFTLTFNKIEQIPNGTEQLREKKRNGLNKLKFIKNLLSSIEISSEISMELMAAVITPNTTYHTSSTVCLCLS